MTYILVEGDDDKIFISYLLEHVLEYKKSLYEINIHGSHNIKKEIATNIRDALSMNFDNFIIINDADNSFLSRKKELEDKMKKESIQGEIFLFPNNKNNGCLEDLLLNCIPKEQEGIPNCFDCFINCLEELEKKGHKVSLPAIKSKIYTYAEVQIFDNDKYKRKTDGSYFYRKHELWNFESEAINPLLSFLKEHVN